MGGGWVDFPPKRTGTTKTQLISDGKCDGLDRRREMSEGTDGKTSGARQKRRIPTEFPTEAFSVGISDGISDGIPSDSVGNPVGIRRICRADLEAAVRVRL